jgi:hypothetical protein
MNMSPAAAQPRRHSGLFGEIFGLIAIGDLIGGRPPPLIVSEPPSLVLEDHEDSMAPSLDDTFEDDLGSYVEPRREALPVANPARSHTRACDKQRLLLERVLNSVYMQATLLLLICFDLSLTVYQISLDVSDPNRAYVAHGHAPSFRVRAGDASRPRPSLSLSLSALALSLSL